MSQSSTFTFIQGSPKGRQKIRRYARRLMKDLPAHRRREEKKVARSRTI